MATGSKNTVCPFVPHVYTHAIVGTVKPTLAEEVNVDPIEVRRQHECLLRVLRELNVEIIEVDFQGSYKTSLLMDRLAVSAQGTVFLPKPKTAAEEYNLRALKDILEVEVKQIVVEQQDPNARVCGSDVLFTGEELIVGLSETTNQAGAIELASTFADYPVCAFRMPTGTDHLKNYVTIAGDEVFAVGPSNEAREILREMERDCAAVYRQLAVTEDKAANCLYVNNTLIHRAIEEIPESFKYFCEKVRYARRSICFSEFDKLSAGLSSLDRHNPEHCDRLREVAAGCTRPINQLDADID